MHLPSRYKSLQKSTAKTVISSNFYDLLEIVLISIFKIEMLAFLILFLHFVEIHASNEIEKDDKKLNEIRPCQYGTMKSCVKESDGKDSEVQQISDIFLTTKLV
jgi:hypothetical protein